MNNLNLSSNIGISDKADGKTKNTSHTGFLDKYLIPLIVALVVINLLIILWCFYNYGFLSAYPTKTTSGKTTQNLNRRPKHPSEKTSPDTLDINGLEITSSAFQLISCADDSLASAVAKVRPSVVYIKTTVPKRNIESGGSTAWESSLSFAPASAAGGSTKNSIGSGVILSLIHI